MSDILEVISTRSSIRAYTNEELTKEQLDALINAGLQAPTATNKQEFHITVVKKGDPILDELDVEKRKCYAANEPDEEKKKAILSAPANFYYDAPIVLFISVDKDFRWSRLDAGIVVENIHLAAHGLGLGSLIIGCVDGALSQEQKGYFSEKLHFPENYEFAIALAVGYPATEKEPHTYDADKQVTYL